MSWFEVAALPNRVFRITEPGLKPLFGANLWLVEGERAALVIDAGIGVAPLAPVIAAITAKPVICLVSHSHYDHIGGAHEFADRRMHAAEAATAARPTARATLWGGWLTDRSFDRLPHPGFTVSTYAVQPAPPTRLVADGERIDLGGRWLDLIHAPGHSPGLMTVFEAESRTLFSSDAVYDGRLFFDLEGSNRADAARSIARLAGLGATTVHPGHFDSLDADRFHRVCAAALADLARA